MELCRTAFAFFICLFAPVQVESQCSCDDGCGNDRITLPGSNGKIVNVAYGKSANMSSAFTRDSASGAACVAVNGRTGTVFISKRDPNTNCVHTDLGDYVAHWQVDLGRNYTVKDITVYRREGNSKTRMADLNVLVDDQLCYTFPDYSDTAALDALPEKINVTCSPPLTGRVVKLQKRRRNTDGQFYFINICEVQVWGCADAYVGPDCQCGHCRDGARCDVTTLECSRGCDRGWGTRFCNQSCPAYKHGYNCSEQCGQCADSDTCNTVTGLCPNGCQPGWKGDDCKQKCDAGKYGINCRLSCGNCSAGDVCHHTNGTCPRGCAAGFDPSDHVCKIVCENGRYGQNCLELCGLCSSDEQCNPVTGTCAVCQPQFHPPFCKVCTGNRYGASCELNCSTSCDGDGSCDKDSGRCVDGCRAGYRPGESGFCNETCEDGKYGKGCAQNCGNCNGDCRHDDGHCTAGCVDGFEGDFCAREVVSSRGSDVPLIAGVASGVVVLISLCVVLAIIIIRRRRNKPGAGSAHPTSSSETVNGSRETALSSVPVTVGLNRQAALQDETGSACVTEAEESHIYDGLQTPDDSDRAPYSTPVFKGKQDNGINSHTYQNSALHSSDTGKDYYNL